MNREIQQRLVWVKLFEETNDAGLVCRRCGISRPTLRKWWKRYSEQGIDGLSSQSKRPLKSPNTKINAELEALILEMRSARNLGARRLQTELMRLHGVSLSLATIHKVLSTHQVKPIKNSVVKQISFVMNAHYQAIEFKWIPVNWVLEYINTHLSMTAHDIAF